MVSIGDPFEYDAVADGDVFESTEIDTLDEGAYSSIKDWLAGAVIAAEVTPLNEALRLAALAGSQAIEPGAATGALALGASTALIEGGAAVSTAHFISAGKKSNRFVNRVSDAYRKLVPENITMSRSVEASFAFLGGTAVLMAAKQVEDPTRDESENRKYGLKAAGLTSAALTVQGALIGNGAENYTSTPAIAGALVAVGSLGAMASYTKRKLQPSVA